MGSAESKNNTPAKRKYPDEIYRQKMRRILSEEHPDNMIPENLHANEDWLTKIMRHIIRDDNQRHE